MEFAAPEVTNSVDREAIFHSEAYQYDSSDDEGLSNLNSPSRVSFSTGFPVRLEFR